MNINIFENSETISKRIKNIRKYYKMNQQDFAKEIGILQSTLSEIERANVSPQFRRYDRSVQFRMVIIRKNRNNKNWWVEQNPYKQLTY